MNRIDKPLQALSLDLPRADRTLERYAVSAAREFPQKAAAKLNRIAFAATHVVADPLADNDPWLDCAIDWDRTIAYREYLWGLGLGVAEAMDTAQRGMGVDWPTSLELIRRSVAAGKARNGLVFSGCGTDQLDPAQATCIDDVIRAYEEQIEAIEAFGGRIVLMASRALARVARSAGRLRQSVWPDPVGRPRAGHHPLAWRHVRSCARRLLGLAGPRHGDGDRNCDHQQQCGQSRRRKGFAARQGPRDRDAPPVENRRAACTPATTSTMPN